MQTINWFRCARGRSFKSSNYNLDRRQHGCSSFSRTKHFKYRQLQSTVPRVKMEQTVGLTPKGGAKRLKRKRTTPPPSPTHSPPPEMEMEMDPMDAFLRDWCGYTPSVPVVSQCHVFFRTRREVWGGRGSFLCCTPLHASLDNSTFQHPTYPQYPQFQQSLKLVSSELAKIHDWRTIFRKQSLVEGKLGVLLASSCRRVAAGVLRPPRH